MLWTYLSDPVFEPSKRKFDIEAYNDASGTFHQIIISNAAMEQLIGLTIFTAS